MTDWQPRPGDVVAPRRTIYRRSTPHYSDRDWMTAESDLIYERDLAPWRTADEIAALEADAEKWRELVRGAEAFRRSPFPPPGPLYQVRHVEELEEMERVIEAGRALLDTEGYFGSRLEQAVDNLDAVRRKHAKEQP